MGGRKMLKFALIATSLLLAACVPKPPDVFVFEQLSQRVSTDPTTGHVLVTPSPTCMKQVGEAECGHGISIMTGREIFVGEAKGHWYANKPWSQLREESAYLPAVESYAPLAAYIIDSCKKMNCSDQVTRFKVKLDSLNGIKGAMANP